MSYLRGMVALTDSCQNVEMLPAFSQLKAPYFRIVLFAIGQAYICYHTLSITEKNHFMDKENT